MNHKGVMNKPREAKAHKPRRFQLPRFLTLNLISKKTIKAIIRARATKIKIKVLVPPIMSSRLPALAASDNSLG